VKSILNKIVRLLIDEVNPTKLILFGSRSKGNARRGSDIDVAVEGGKSLSHREERKLKEKIEEISGIYFVDIVFLEKTSADFKNMIRKTGKVIYEKK